MQIKILAMLCSGVMFSLCALAQEQVLNENMENPGYIEEPDWFKESFLDIREDIGEANDNGKRLLLYFHQDGCPYCKKLIQDNFGQKQTSDLTQQYFDTISINMWGDREVTDFSGSPATEKSFARQMKVQFTPTMLMLDEKGEVALRINGYYPPAKFIAALHFGGQGLEKEQRFRDYLAQIELTETSGQIHNDERFLQPPFHLAESLIQTDKPLLVMFEQKQCLACDELHEDILQREESRQLLNRFQVAVVDMWSKEQIQTPDRQTTAINRWAEELDIHYAPAMVFFDRTGREVFRTEAYLKAFHIQSGFDYVASGAYLTQPEFQRFIELRADDMRARGIEVDLMK